jgi:hypothetical protein
MSVRECWFSSTSCILRHQCLVRFDLHLLLFRHRENQGFLDHTHFCNVLEIEAMPMMSQRTKIDCCDVSATNHLSQISPPTKLLQLWD